LTKKNNKINNFTKNNNLTPTLKPVYNARKLIKGSRQQKTQILT